MYCKYCGKQTENTFGICDGCLGKLDEIYGEKPAVTEPDAPAEQVALTAPVSANELPVTTEKTAEYGKLYGLGEAITSAVLGIENIIILIAMRAFGGVVNVLNFADNLAQFVSYLFIFGIPIAIISLTFGSKAVKKYARASKAGVKPFVTLIFGIIGIVVSAFALTSLPAVFFKIF